MRESQKMSLDYKLHTKIIASIVKIQRWFKTKIQKSKFNTYRAAAIKIQSVWRMHSAQKLLANLRLRTNAAIIIQSVFRMFRQRKLFNKLRNGIVVLQAHAKGKFARKRFQKMWRQKIMKERYKLRPTQSLPIDKSIDGVAGSDISRSYPKLVKHSLDLDEVSSQVLSTDKDHLHETENTQYKANIPLDVISHKTEMQLKNLPLSSGSYDEELLSRPHLNKTTSTNIQSTESVDSRSVRSYNLEYASKQSLDENIISQR